MKSHEFEAFSRALRAWYRRAKRPLPWRATREPYAIWVSEVILQQTTIAAGEPRWRRFLARFPDVAALAAASESDVLAEWSGLGYYARARNLHRAAREIARLGAFPRKASALRGLPGVGPYTAAAVASIAFGERVACVDGNVVRVLARVFALRVPARGAAPSVVALAQRLVPARDAGAHNQALMDLGATICTPRAPRCGECPVRVFCDAAAKGRPERYPLAPERRPTEAIRLAAGLARRRDGLVVTDDAELVKGHLIVPLVRVADGGDATAALAAAWRESAGRDAGALTPLGRVRHSVLSRRYTVDLFAVREAGRLSPSAARVISLTELSLRPRGGLFAKLLALAKLEIAP